VRGHYTHNEINKQKDVPCKCEAMMSNVDVSCGVKSAQMPLSIVPRSASNLSQISLQ
jgi:hypothetical protein